MRNLITLLILLCSLTVVAAAQSLPAGKWQLEECKFGPASEQPLKGIATTLVIKSEGKLGGNSGCNAYGGTYTVDKGKLAITDIISTMRACEEPTPTFEKDYFNTLENATSAEVKDDTLVITDKNGRYLRFARSKK